MNGYFNFFFNLIKFMEPGRLEFGKILGENMTTLRLLKNSINATGLEIYTRTF